MKLPHKKFCVLPWVSLEASPIGTVRPCCLADNEIVDDTGNKVRLGEISFDEIRNTQYMKQLRQEFLQEQQPETCRRCWAEEDAGRTSKRMHTLDRLKHLVDDREWTLDAEPLTFLDLKLGNICNLKCRICGSWSSSTYAAEEIKFQTDKKNNFHYTMTKLGAWPRQTPEFWQELEKHMESLRYLEFTGGEPFMIQEHFNLLEHLADLGYAHNIEIHYNTNGTIFPEAAEKIWSKFKHVEIAFSVDDVGARFEYQRANANWEEVKHNIERFYDMRKRLSNMTLQVCCTINVFNVMYLEDVALWIGLQDFDFVYWNMLHDAPQFSIASLPIETKKEITKRLMSATFDSKFQDEINRIIDFMNNGASTNGDELRRSIRIVDSRRNQNLQSVAPEFARALNYET